MPQTKQQKAIAIKLKNTKPKGFEKFGLGKKASITRASVIGSDKGDGHGQIDGKIVGVGVNATGHEVIKIRITKKTGLNPRQPIKRSAVMFRGRF